MDRIKVDLLHYTPDFVATNAVKKPYKNERATIETSVKVASPPISHTSVAEHVVLNFNISGISRACFSEDTEVMTDTGFKLFKDLDGTEKIATLNKSGVVEWQTPTNYVKQYRKEYIDHWEQQTVDLLVTKDHRMMYKKAKNIVRTTTARNEIHYVKSSDINISAIKFIAGFPLVNKGLPELIDVNGDSYERRNRNRDFYVKNIETLKIKKHDFLKLLAIYLSDGSTYYNEKENSYTISISDSTDNHGRILDAFNKCGIHAHSDGKLTITAKSRQFGRLFKSLGVSYEKYIPLNVLEFSKEDASVFIETYLLGDGHINKKEPTKCALYTTSKQLSEQLCHLIRIAGFIPNIHLINRIGEKNVLKNGAVITQKRIYYCIDFSKKHVRNIEPIIRPQIHRHDEFYDGYVYCVSVPNGNLYVRRKNKKNPVWCGNCLAELMRHRMSEFEIADMFSSATVESTRYTLSKATDININDIDIADFFVIPPIDNRFQNQDEYEKYIIELKSFYYCGLGIMKLMSKHNVPNDFLKYFLPEGWRVDLAFSINLRSFLNFISLRNHPRAHFEIRHLAKMMLDSIRNTYLIKYFPNA